MRKFKLPSPYVESFQERLIESKGEDDDVLDSEVWRVIRALRVKRALAPWLQLVQSAGFFVVAVGQSIKWIWRYANGQHRGATTQVHGGANQAPGTSAGTVSPAGAITAFTITGRAGYAGIPAGQSPGLNPAPAFVGAASYVTEFEDAGIKAGEIVAFRCWKLSPIDGLLHSVVYEDFIWPPGETVEGDPSDGHGGIYAFKSVLLLHDYGRVDDGPLISVTGTVELWGDVYEHARGYRAQYAAIRSIDDSAFYDAKALRRKYGLTKRRKRKNA